MKQMLIAKWKELDEQRWHVPSMYIYDIKQRMARIECVLLDRYGHDVYSNTQL